jgi:uncharacterized membrane-anchored protein
MEEALWVLAGASMLATEVYLTVFVAKNLKKEKTFPKVVLVFALVIIWLLNLSAMFD